MIKHAKGYSKTDMFEKILRGQILVTKSTDPEETSKAFEFSDLKKYLESTYSTDYELIWVSKSVRQYQWYEKFSRGTGISSPLWNFTPPC